MSNTVTVCVTDRNGVYVDNYRITNRSTKWISNIVAEFKSDGKDVIDSLMQRGFVRAVRLIDEEPYLSQARTALKENRDD